MRFYWKINYNGNILQATVHVSEAWVGHEKARPGINESTS